MSCLHKTNYEFNIQTAAMFVFFVFDKNNLIKSLKVVPPLKIYQNKKCHGPTLTGASFASTSEV
jgi:hypothetical protein